MASNQMAPSAATAGLSPAEMSQQQHHTLLVQQHPHLANPSAGFCSPGVTTGATGAALSANTMGMPQQQQMLHHQSPHISAGSVNTSSNASSSQQQQAQAHIQFMPQLQMQHHASPAAATNVKENMTKMQPHGALPHLQHHPHHHHQSMGVSIQENPHQYGASARATTPNTMMQQQPSYHTVPAHHHNQQSQQQQMLQLQQLHEPVHHSSLIEQQQHTQHATSAAADIHHLNSNRQQEPNPGAGGGENQMQQQQHQHVTHHHQHHQQSSPSPHQPRHHFQQQHGPPVHQKMPSGGGNLHSQQHPHFMPNTTPNPSAGLPSSAPSHSAQASNVNAGANNPFTSASSAYWSSMSLSAIDVATAFAFQYYRLLSTKPYECHRFYVEDSQITRGSTIVQTAQFQRIQGMVNINNCLATSTPGMKQALLHAVEGQMSITGSVVVMILGVLIFADDVRRPFSHTVLLVPQRSSIGQHSFYVLNDIFVFNEGSPDDTPRATSNAGNVTTGQFQTPSTTATATTQTTVSSLPAAQSFQVPSGGILHSGGQLSSGAGSQAALHQTSTVQTTTMVSGTSVNSGGLMGSGNVSSSNDAVGSVGTSALLGTMHVQPPLTSAAGRGNAAASQPISSTAFASGVGNMATGSQRLPAHFIGEGPTPGGSKTNSQVQQPQKQLALDIHMDGQQMQNQLRETVMAVSESYHMSPQQLVGQRDESTIATISPVPIQEQNEQPELHQRGVHRFEFRRSSGTVPSGKTLTSETAVAMAISATKDNMSITVASAVEHHPEIDTTTRASHQQISSEREESNLVEDHNAAFQYPDNATTVSSNQKEESFLSEAVTVPVASSNAATASSCNKEGVVIGTVANNEEGWSDDSGDEPEDERHMSSGMQNVTDAVHDTTIVAETGDATARDDFEAAVQQPQALSSNLATSGATSVGGEEDMGQKQSTLPSQMVRQSAWNVPVNTSGRANSNAGPSLADSANAAAVDRSSLSAKKPQEPGSGAATTGFTSASDGSGPTVVRHAVQMPKRPEASDYEQGSYAAKLLIGNPSMPKVGYVCARENVKGNPDTNRDGNDKASANEKVIEKTLWVDHIPRDVSDDKIKKAVSNILKGEIWEGRVVKIDRLRGGGAHLTLDSELCVDSILYKGLHLQGQKVNVERARGSGSFPTGGGNGGGGRRGEDRWPTGRRGYDSGERGPAGSRWGGGVGNGMKENDEPNSGFNESHSWENKDNAAGPSVRGHRGPPRGRGPRSAGAYNTTNTANSAAVGRSAQHSASGRPDSESQNYGGRDVESWGLGQQRSGDEGGWIDPSRKRGGGKNLSRRGGAGAGGGANMHRSGVKSAGGGATNRGSAHQSSHSISGSGAAGIDSTAAVAHQPDVGICF